MAKKITPTIQRILDSYENHNFNMNETLRALGYKVSTGTGGVIKKRCEEAVMATTGKSLADYYGLTRDKLRTVLSEGLDATKHETLIDGENETTVEVKDHNTRHKFLTTALRMIGDDNSESNETKQGGLNIRNLFVQLNTTLSRMDEIEARVVGKGRGGKEPIPVAVGRTTPVAEDVSPEQEEVEDSGGREPHRKNRGRRKRSTVVLARPTPVSVDSDTEQGMDTVGELQSTEGGGASQDNEAMSQVGNQARS